MGYTPHATRYNEHVCPPLYAAPSGCVVPQPVVPHRLYGTELSSSYSNNNSSSSSYAPHYAQFKMANAPQPNVPPGTETPGLTKSWGTKSLSGLGWLSRLSPWSNDPTPVSSKKRILGEDI